ncbi:MAG: hybrid sensor histidine kinase/response regulator [Burkholderia sp.]|nr:hybrid sensor histidine kinase/response regulator [Burkholderia sp.]
MHNLPPNFPWANIKADVAPLMRQLDRTSCVLGPPQAWPQQLHTVLGLVLQSRSPAAVIWGDELTTLYNDAYARQLGDKHPAILGKSFRSMWSEIWPEIETIIDDALAGESSYFEDVPYKVQPTDVPTQRWYTSSFSPVIDSDGTVVGIYITAIETTQRMQAEIRYAFQSELTDCLRDLIDPDAMTVAASTLLGRRLNVERVGYASWAKSGDQLIMRPDWTNGEPRYSAGTEWRFDDFGPAFTAELRAGKIVAVSDVSADERTAPHASVYAASGIRSLLAIPLVKAGRLRAILQIRHPSERWWSDLDITLARDTAERTWAAVERATAEVHERQATEALKYLAARQKFQLLLADRIRPLADPDEVVAVASELIGKHLGVARVVYCSADRAGNTVTMKPDWTNGELPSIAGRYFDWMTLAP